MSACSLGSFGTGCQQSETGEKTFRDLPLHLCHGCPAMPAVRVLPWTWWELGIIEEVYVVSSLLMRPLFSLPPQTKERCQKQTRKVSDKPYSFLFWWLVGISYSHCPLPFSLVGDTHFEKVFLEMASGSAWGDTLNPFQVGTETQI